LDDKRKEAEIDRAWEELEMPTCFHFNKGMPEEVRLGKTHYDNIKVDCNTIDRSVQTTLTL